MGQKFSIPTPNPFQNFRFSAFKRGSAGRPSFCQNGIFAALMKLPVDKRGDVTPLISSCISTASARTQEYLAFKDPEGKLHPSPQVLTQVPTRFIDIVDSFPGKIRLCMVTEHLVLQQVFLMTCISQSVRLHATDTFSCTAMTPEQRVLLGADWVWAVLEQPAKNPKTQIAVQVLHLPEWEEAEESATTAEACSESVRMAQMESSDKNMCERMVDFCSSVGEDCYALFLFFGRKDDRKNIYGVLSNNFEAAVGKCDKIDRALIENFFRGLRYFYTPSGMMQAIVSKKTGDPLTLMIKFS